MTMATSTKVTSKPSFLEIFVITLGHTMTHWYPATFYLLLPLIGKELGLSYGEIGAIMTCQYLVGAISNVPGGLAVDFVSRNDADGDFYAVGWRAVLTYGTNPHILAAARLFSTCRCRQQSLASSGNPIASAAISRKTRTGGRPSWDGRQSWRCDSAVRVWCIANYFELARGRYC